MNFLSKLQIFKDSANWDEEREYYVPEGTDVSLPNQKWYGIKNGKYKYSGSRKWLRDYRIRMVFVTTDKPFLWGKCFRENFDVSFLCDTDEANSQLFFGCKSWSDLLTDDFIYRVVNDMHLDDFRQNVIALRQAGFSKEQWVSIYKSGLHTVAPKYILDAKQHDLLHHGDLRDMIDWLDALGLTIKEAKSLWQETNTGRKITVTFKNKPMDYKSRTPKKNLHDFLSAIILSCKRKYINGRS